VIGATLHHGRAADRHDAARPLDHDRAGGVNRTLFLRRFSSGPMRSPRWRPFW
jgi:hypothetical protein